MSSDHLAWRSTASTDRPISLTPRLSNSGFSLASAPSSVVQTGVKSFGCENNSAQPLPIQSWNLILPSVVWASKSGAVAPMGSGMLRPHIIQVTRKFCPAEYRQGGGLRERLHVKDEILLRRNTVLAPSFDTRPCGEKSSDRSVLLPR